MLLAGVVASLIDRSRADAETITYTYDPQGRVTRAAYSNGVIVDYSYDAAGNRTQLVRAGGISPPPAPSGTLAASPTSITQGGSSTLTWTTANATSAWIDNGVGAVAPIAGGSISVSPAATTTYTLSLAGPSGATTRTAAVTVNSPAFNQTIAITGPGPVNLRTLANAAGYTGAQNATIIFQLASGVTITGASGSGAGIDTGAWPSAAYTTSLTLQISGTVHGGGGNGGGGGSGAGDTGQAGAGGGHAINCQNNITITVNAGGVVRGGGGGGGGGRGTTTLSGAGDPLLRGGGGGGGGFPNGVGGAAGAHDVGVPGPGASGTSSGGGVGGGAGGGGTGAGGAGGGAAAAGTAGAGPGALAGAAGYAIRKNGKTVPVTNNGTIVGTQG
jgi:YD repeat-containing protein